MTPQQLLILISTCPLIEDTGIQNGNEVYFHLVGVDQDDMEECSDKGHEVDKFLISIGVNEEDIMWNDCEGNYGEGMVSLDEQYAE